MMARWGTRFVAVLLFVTLVLLSRPGRADGFVFLVHPSNPATSLSVAELRRAVTGDTKQWNNGAVIHLGIIPSEAPETRFLAALVGTSVGDLLSRIQQQVFAGEMRRPAVLRSSADCVAFAQSSAGALCVAAASAVPPDAHVLVVK